MRYSNSTNDKELQVYSKEKKISDIDPQTTKLRNEETKQKIIYFLQWDPNKVGDFYIYLTKKFKLFDIEMIPISKKQFLQSQNFQDQKKMAVIVSIGNVSSWKDYLDWRKKYLFLRVCNRKIQLIEMSSFSHPMLSSNRFQNYLHLQLPIIIDKCASRIIEFYFKNLL